jgi:uncharacterized protein YecE (DUF72 family)
MDFGRLADLEGVDFGLPPIDAFFVASSPGAREIVVGAPAWSKKAWVGRVYPPGTPPARYLAAYAERYGAIELDATFHRTPSVEQAEAWARSAPDGFTFLPKLSKTISQARGLAAAPEELERFAAFARALGDKLGPSLLSLPPALTIRDGRALRSFLERWPSELPLAVELRHESWFRDRALDERVRALFRAHRVTAVVSDTAGRRDAAHGSLTTPFAFVRFAGNGLHPTDFARLDRWAERLSELFERGLERAWFFVHQPDDETTPETLSYAAEAFERATGLPVKAARVGGAEGGARGSEGGGQLALF